MIKSYTCLLKDLEGERQEGKGEFQEGKMKTRATALSSEAVCNLTTGSASLPLTEPGLFRKSLTESLSVPAAFETAFLLENLNYSIEERELKLRGRSGAEGTSASQSGQRALSILHFIFVVLFFFIPSLIVFAL